MSEPFLKVEKISKSFSGVHVLSEVSMSVQPGEIHCLIGENGCGKSTIIKMISGVLVPDNGQIVIDGKTFKSLRPLDAIKEGIQVIYQDFSLFPNLTVAENIALNGQVAENRKFVNWRKVRQVAETVLKNIGANIHLNALVQDLPVADKQLVAICRALAQNARLIIMDEPTTALTEHEVKSLFQIIKQLQSQGISVIFVSHKLNEVFEICEHITVLRNGKNVADGDVASFTRDSLIRYMTGRDIETRSFEYTKLPGNDHSLLEVKGLSRKGVFEDVSFEVQPGEILGITGLLGSGRTELALALFGVKPADSGEVYLDNKAVRIHSVQEAVKHGIAYVPEDRLTEGLFLTQAIGKNIVAGSVRGMRSRFGFLNPKQINNKAMNWIRDLHILTPSDTLPVTSLSGGNQQRVVLAKWLERQPRLLILNGPTVGVDVGSKAEIHDILRKLAGGGMGVIIISDDIPELLQNCNRIFVMRKGRFVDEVTASQISENELVQKLSEDVKGVAR